MQDFTNLSNPNLAKTPIDAVAKAVPNAFGGIYDKRVPKKTFVELKKNKTNFWNLMFATGMVLGFWLSSYFGREYLLKSFISIWFTIIEIPLIVRHFSKVKFSDGKFFTSENEELDLPTQMPNAFFVVATTLVTIISVGLIVDSLDKKHSAIINVISTPILLLFFFFIPVLFFIFKNCPISILFNYQFYKQNMKFSNSRNFEHRTSSNSDYKPASFNTNLSSNWMTDPSKSYLPGNIYRR